MQQSPVPVSRQFPAFPVAPNDLYNIILRVKDGLVGSFDSWYQPLSTYQCHISNRQDVKVKCL